MVNSTCQEPKRRVPPVQRLEAKTIVDYLKRKVPCIHNEDAKIKRFYCLSYVSKLMTTKPEFRAWIFVELSKNIGIFRAEDRKIMPTTIFICHLFGCLSFPWLLEPPLWFGSLWEKNLWKMPQNLNPKLLHGNRLRACFSVHSFWVCGFCL